MAGVDVGGTFTDFVFLDATGQLTVRKRPSTPADPSESVTQGLLAARSAGEVAAGFFLSHGTTVATNALLQRRGADAALLITQGFRDTLAIGRQERRDLYALHPSRIAPLLPRASCFEITERLNWRGEIVTPLDRAAARLLLEELRARGVQSVAVCFLFSYLNPAHERVVGEMARAMGFSVSLSCEIAPEPREFERASTTAANAFVAPILERYLTRLEARTQEAEAANLRVMQSNGGALSAREASEQAVKTALSGPAGGVVAAMELGRQLGLSRLMTFDMGGTSTDAALIADGECPTITTGELGGLPLRTPMLDIHTVGAGGGSLARIDAAGGLRVGPQSAGADPGPVAYGKGETLTVTDANILLGRLPEAARLGGGMALNTERVKTYFDALAAALGCSPEAAALGVAQIANATMARALRHISVERGHDPADFTLVSFGGAGGLHACELAEALQMRSALVPRYPGAFSALGLALAPARREIARAFPALALSALTPDAMNETLSEIWDTLSMQAEREMAAGGLKTGDWNAVRFLDLRYSGQSFSLRIPCAADDPGAIVAAFHRAHRARYGHASEREPVEATAARLVATGNETRPRLQTAPPTLAAAPFAVAPVRFAAGWQETPLYQRDHLARDQAITGPAIFLQADATTLLFPQWNASVDALGNISMRK